jgi:acetyl esterase/lipase
MNLGSLDSDLAAVARALPDMAYSDISEMRAANDRLTRALPVSYRGVAVDIVQAPGLDGDPDVSIRLMRPSDRGDDAPPSPVLVAIHGGGYVLGSARDFDYFCVEVVRELGFTVANVDYRLAPETPFPGPFRDCVAALRFVSERSDELGVDAARIAVGGSSAGAGLAAAVVLHARDAGGPPIAFQLLLSPALDDDLGASASADGSTEDEVNLGWRTYIGDGYTGVADPDVSPYAVPARAADLSGLPPAYVAAMEVDLLRDSNIRYAQRMMQAGVAVELHVHPGTFHGSVELAPAAASSARIRHGLIDALRRALSADEPAAAPSSAE